MPNVANVADVAIVTDSTADLPAAVVEEFGITVVPLKVIFGQEVYLDGVNIENNTFYNRLLAGEVATTSQPSPSEFEATYRRLLETAQTIISIHISRNLSGTVNSAEIARQSLPKADIEIIDSRLVSGALGLIVKAAAQAAREGKPKAQILSVIAETARATRIFFGVDSLDYLQRGGRIGKAAAFLGTILNIKPILTVREGTINPVEKVRGSKAALRLLAEMVPRETGSRPLSCHVLHGNNPTAAKELGHLLSDLPPESTLEFSPVGPVVGAHVGPGVFGVAFCGD